MTKIPSVEDYSIDITSDLAGVLPSGLYDKLEERTIKGLTEHRLALLTKLRDSELLENKPMNVFSFVLQGEELEHYMRYKGHNLAVEAIKAHLDKLIKSTSI